MVLDGMAYPELRLLSLISSSVVHNYQSQEKVVLIIALIASSVNLLELTQAPVYILLGLMILLFHGQLGIFYLEG